MDQCDFSKQAPSATASAVAAGETGPTERKTSCRTDAPVTEPPLSQVTRRPWKNSGITLPLLGFGNVLWQGVKEAVDQNGFIGIFMGGFKAGAVGISAALIFGYIASFIFDPKMKK